MTPRCSDNFFPRKHQNQCRVRESNTVPQYEKSDGQTIKLIRQIYFKTNSAIGFVFVMTDILRDW